MSIKKFTSADDASNTDHGNVSVLQLPVKRAFTMVNGRTLKGFGVALADGGGAKLLFLVGHNGTG